ncbi:ThuA domain-containing protein [Pseudorhodoferax sp.]|uniref:ThuA domain-containing protein n=1 Tax=Pseudorhodoferax sp. TaxID=1993553 RepID=UPI002DD69596|nr:ThuA domain-containing protein [Pseudorhodoferax sp.]
MRPAGWLASLLLGLFVTGLPMKGGASASQPPLRVVLIGGTGSEGPGRHEYAQGVAQIAAWLRRQPVPGRRLVVDVFAQGWPADARVLQGAATVLLYGDGEGRHPLHDPARRQAFERLMRQGVGLVALHQASTVPASGAGSELAPLLQRWLGAVRPGFFDRSTQTATLFPADHPVAQGLPPFVLRDEFYPTLRFAAEGVTPVLAAQLEVQHRQGRPVLDAAPEQTIVAWAYQRPGGGRSVGYTGGHFLQALAEPTVQRLLRQAVFWTAGLGPDAADPARTTAVQASAADVTGFHGGAARSGWLPLETRLPPAVVSAADFGMRWQSPPLHADGDAPPRLYASPLYIDRLTLSAGPLRGQLFSAVLAATSNGDVYAVNAAAAGDIVPGRVLWRTKLADACRLQPAPLDGVATGVLATPVIDRARGRLYVTHCDPQRRWQAYALDLGSGAVLPGWPVVLDEATLNAVNHNAGPEPVPPRRRFDFRVQRGALNLSPDGSRLYVVFGETETGWLVSVDTQKARIDSSFAAAAMPHRGSGGIWGAGGPAVDEQGRIHVVTGSGFDGYREQPHDWTQSLLQLSDAPGRGLRLVGSYTPFNHCRSARHDIDLGSGGAALLPPAAGANHARHRLLLIGGKQGNAYLLDSERLPGRLDRRPPCSDDASSDASLLAPGVQPQFGTRGPLNVFGPYSEEDAALDLARARSVPAAMRLPDGQARVFMTGNSRAAPGSAEAVAPSLVQLAVVDENGPAAHLQVQRQLDAPVFGNPGSPLVSGAGDHAVVWVLDANARRSALLVGAGAPAPVLHAFDAATLRPLWRSAAGQLHTSGKYNQPLIAAGQVIVGTDRLQAFGPGAARGPAPAAPVASAVATPAAATAPAAMAAEPAAIWAQRCAVCHQQPQGNVPPLAHLKRLPVPRIVDALSQGAMRVHAAGLPAAQIEALARWLATEGRP